MGAAIVVAVVSNIVSTAILVGVGLAVLGWWIGPRMDRIAKQLRKEAGGDEPWRESLDLDPEES